MHLSTHSPHPLLMANIQYLALEWDSWFIGSKDIHKLERSDISREGCLVAAFNDHTYRQKTCSGKLVLANRQMLPFNMTG